MSVLKKLVEGSVLLSCSAKKWQIVYLMGPYEFFFFLLAVIDSLHCCTHKRHVSSVIVSENGDTYFAMFTPMEQKSGTCI